MSRYQFLNWPFLEDEVVSIYWITSPKVVPNTGAKRCTVYFQRMPRIEPEPVSTPWGMMPELWIGRRFKNGMPIGEPEAIEKPIVIQTSYIRELKIETAATAIPGRLYSLFKKHDLCVEHCVRFRYYEKQYIIPCLELARAFYMENSLLTNQLLTEGGLENLIELSSWKVNDKALEFNFSPPYSLCVNKHLACTVATLYGISELRDGWQQIYAEYVRDRKISTGIPLIPGLKLQCTGIKGDGCIFLTAVELSQLSPPFNSIQYGPDLLEHVSKSGGSKKIFHTEKTTDRAEIGDADAAAQYGFCSSIFGGRQRMRFSKFITISRRKSKSSDEGGILGIDAGEATAFAYTPNDRTGRGTLPFLNIEPREEAEITKDPDFSEFCNALNDLTAIPVVANVKVSYGILPGENSFSYLNGKTRRKFAFAEVIVGGKAWVIIELCLKDGYSLSTLFVQNNGNAKELANFMIGKLLMANGHWTQECFKSGYQYRTLDHHKGRTSRRWAELMCSKMF